jgi:hypothetical protein
MWKVYWHMRPAVCAMEEMIFSNHARTGGYMADPFLNSMFCYQMHVILIIMFHGKKNMSFDG